MIDRVTDNVHSPVNHRSGNTRNTNTLVERLTVDARRVLPGWQFCGRLNDGLSSVSDELLRYVVALLHGTPMHPPEVSKQQWTELLNCLAPHWVIPQLYYQSGSLPAEFAPPKAITDSMRSEFLRSRVRAVHMDAQLGELLEAFRNEVVPFLVLKGPALAYAVYSNSAARPSSDLDLLVHPKMMAKARTILYALRYTCMGKKYEVAKQLYREELFAPPENSPIHRWIEVHWDLTEFSWPGRQRRVQDLFDRAVNIATPAVTFKALSPVDALIHRALNNGWQHHRDMRLIWINDVALLARHLKVPDHWEMLQKQCEVWRCRLAMESSLKLAQAWIGLQLPTGFDDFSAWPPAIAEREMWTTVTNRHNRFIPYLRLLLSGSADTRDLLRASFHLLFPDRAWMRIKYPPADGWRLPVAYARRWWRWVSKGFR